MSTLSDHEIAAEIAAGRLIRQGGDAQLSGASYELRLGNVYYDLTESDRPIHIAEGQSILIKPGHRVVLITYEELCIPKNILARVVSKGSLFSVGLSPAATHADPGFTGRMGIVTQNMSDKYIVLPQLMSIAKVDFTVLSAEVKRPYIGQHGYHTEIWPIKYQLQKTYSEVAADPRVGSEVEEGYKLLPYATRTMLGRLGHRRRFFDAAIVAAVVLNALVVFLVSGGIINNLQGLIGSLAASLIVAAVVILPRRGP
mgnify:CR=1 FL=1